MDLVNTLILESDNQDSRVQLTSLLHENDILIVVILGTAPVANAAIQVANNSASGVIAGIKRKAIWMKDLGMLPYLTTQIKDGPEFLIRNINTHSTIGISISMDHLLMDIIPSSPSPDALRMEIAFINAGKSH